jgi:hypothetical protein
LTRADKSPLRESNLYNELVVSVGSIVFTGTNCGEKVRLCRTFRFKMSRNTFKRYDMRRTMKRSNG